MKIAIVTGASGNLGKAVCARFLEEGYHVTGTIRTAGEASALQHERFSPVMTDLLDEQAAGDLIRKVTEKYGKVDVAVLTAGGYTAGGFDDTSAADIEKQLRLNFITAFNVVRPLFPYMMKQGEGKLFLLGSRPGEDMRNSKGMLAYGFSKSLLFRLAEFMNNEARGTALTTHVVVPSTIDTPENRRAMPGADFSKWARPEEIAALISFYCSEKGRMLGGGVIRLQ